MRYYYAKLNNDILKFKTPNERTIFLTENPTASETTLIFYAMHNNMPWAFWSEEDRERYFKQQPNAVKITSKEAWEKRNMIWILGYECGCFNSMTRMERNMGKTKIYE